MAATHHVSPALVFEPTSRILTTFQIFIHKHALLHHFVFSSAMSSAIMNIAQLEASQHQDLHVQFLAGEALDL